MSSGGGRRGRGSFSRTNTGRGRGRGRGGRRGGGRGSTSEKKSTSWASQRDEVRCLLTSDDDEGNREELCPVVMIMEESVWGKR
jgi:hypothetical protein